MSMKTVCLILTAAVASTLAFASDNDAVTRAAGNTSEIPAIVAELKTPRASFAGDVMSAIASMPKSPVKKTEKMISAAKALIPLADEKKLDDMVVALVANTPFEALPVWTDKTRDAVQAIVASMDDKTYDALLASVMRKIGALKDYSNDDKTVVSTFALKLLARGKDVPARIESTAKAIKAIPAAYGKQVIEALPSALEGDYAPILGDTKIISIPKFEKARTDSKVPTDLGANIPHGIAAPTIAEVKEPVVVPPVEPVAPVPPAPPVPPVYAEQF